MRVDGGEANFTSEQMAILDIKPPRQSWASRLGERVAGTMVRGLTTGIKMGAAGFISGLVFVEVTTRLSDVFFPGSLSHGFADSFRMGFSTVMIILGFFGGAIYHGVTYAMTGKEPWDL